VLATKVNSRMRPGPNGAGLYDVVQRLQRLLDRRCRVPAMDLVEIDIIGAQAVQAVVDLGKDGAARQAGTVGAGPHARIDLGRQHDLLAPSEILDGAADDLLRRAVRIDIGGIEEGDAKFDRLAQQRPALVLWECPGMIAAVGFAIGHAAQANARNFQTGRTELDVIH